MIKFMLGCGFIFEAYAKNIRETATKCSLKNTEFPLDSDGYVLCKFDIYQGTMAPNCFKRHTNS